MRNAPWVRVMTAADFPLADLARSAGFHPLDERVRDMDAVLALAERFLDCLAIHLVGFDAAEHVQNFIKSLKPRGLERHRSSPDSTACEGVIRHYMILWRWAGPLTMNDKRHVSIGDAPGPTVTEMIRGMSDRTL